MALSGCRHGEVARRLLAGDRTARRSGRGPGAMFALAGDWFGADSFYLELQHHLLPDDDWLVAETVRLADGRRAADGRDQRRALRVCPPIASCRTCWCASVTASRSRRARTCAVRTASTTSRASRRSGAAAGDAARSANEVARAWAEGSANAGELAARCSVDFDFEQYRFPGFAVPSGRRRSPISRRCATTGMRRRYHPLRARGGEAAGPRAGGDRADRPGRVLPDLLGHHAVLPRARHPGPGPRQRRRFDRRLRARASRASTPSATSCSSSASSTRAAPRTRTSTSTSPRRVARRSSSTATSATAPSTRAWSATWSRTGHGRRSARSATRSAFRGRSSIAWPRRSRRTTRSWSGATWRPRAASPSSSPRGRGRESATWRRCNAGCSTRWASSTTDAAPSPCRRRSTRNGSGRRGAARGISDDEGGPGDTPVSVRWLRARAGRERQNGEVASRARSVRPRPVDRRPCRPCRTPSTVRRPSPPRASAPALSKPISLPSLSQAEADGYRPSRAGHRTSVARLGEESSRRRIGRNRR